jgi:hypothetical protein
MSVDRFVTLALQGGDDGREIVALAGTGELEGALDGGGTLAFAGGTHLSASPSGVEAEARIAVGVAEMPLPLAAFGGAGGEPARAGLEPLVIGRIGRRRGRGLDAVAAGEVEMDEPGLGARRIAGVGGRDTFRPSQ